jgi:hypothetical protein
MRTSFHAIVPLLIGIVATTPAAYADDSNISNYKCSQFLEDVIQPKQGAPLLRSMLAIAWSTGYAAAYQKDNTRADPKAFRLMAATLAAACTLKPDSTVVEAAAQEIHTVFSKSQ